MRRDGIAPRPPAGIGERAWWLEEVLARTPLCAWPGPTRSSTAGSPDEWVATVRRGLARAAAAQRDPVWAAALVDGLADDVAAHGRPDDRLLVEALYDALPPDDLAARAAAALRRGLAGATAAGVEHVLALLPAALAAGASPTPSSRRSRTRSAAAAPAGGWPALCELAALRLPADLAPRAAALVERAARRACPTDPGGAVVGPLRRHPALPPRDDRGARVTDDRRPTVDVQRRHAEDEYAAELAALADGDDRPGRRAGGCRPGRW